MVVGHLCLISFLSCACPPDITFNIDIMHAACKYCIAGEKKSKICGLLLPIFSRGTPALFSDQILIYRITEVYYEDPRRGYGSSVSSVFTKLKTTEFSDVFAPATEQFKGEGSCGNGSAMRISPAALFGFNDDKLLVEVCILG